MPAQAVSTPKAPQAVGPYSQAITGNGLVFVSGQIPIDPKTGAIVEGTITEQTERILANIDSILQAANSSLSSVLKTTVYLTNLQDFEEMNRAYGQAFGTHRPARATVEVSRLPKGAKLEIEAVALVR